MFTREELNLIAAFRGIPESTSRSTLRKEHNISDLIEKALKKYKIAENKEENTIMKNWRDIIGSQNAHRCRPHMITAQGELVIVILNPTLRSELQMQKRSILNRIQTLAPELQINDIAFRVG